MAATEGVVGDLGGVGDEGVQCDPGARGVQGEPGRPALGQRTADTLASAVTLEGETAERAIVLEERTSTTLSVADARRQLAAIDSRLIALAAESANLTTKRVRLATAVEAATAQA